MRPNFSTTLQSLARPACSRLTKHSVRNFATKAAKQKTKEEAAKNAKTGLNQWKNLGLNQQALLDQLVKQQQQKARGSSSSSSNLNSQLGSASQQERFKIFFVNQFFYKLRLFQLQLLFLNLQTATTCKNNCAAE